MVKSYDEAEIPAVYDADDIPRHEPREGFSMKLFRSLDSTVAFVHAEPGAETNYHTHPWEQVVCVIDGAADFYIDPEEFAIEPGSVFFVPPSVEHELRPREDESVDMISIWPLREGFLEHTAYQEEFDVEDAFYNVGRN